MAYNGSGTFLINTAGQPVVAGTVISSTTFNSLTADLATGLSTVITKDGQTTVTANIPMASFKFTGLGVGSAAGDSANLSQVQSTVTKLLASVSGADTVTATASPTLAAYAAGQMFYFVAAGDNTTSVTLNIDALGAKAVTRDGSTALVAADIKSGEVIVVVYDGTRFQVVSQLNSAGNATFANVSITSALNVGGVATFSAGSAAAPSITTTGDTNTGLFFPAADTIAFTEGGVESMRIDSSGNLGIGTSSPAVKLQVAGAIRSSSSVTGPLANLFTSATNPASTGASGAGLNFGYDSNGEICWIQANRNDITETRGLLLNPNGGNLGIGTSSPASKLDVVGGTGIRVNEDGAGTKVIQIRSNFASVGPAINVSTNDPLLFQTNNTERMRLDSSGNLGIGTTTIGSRVTIGDPGTGLTFTNATAASGFNIGLLAGTGSAQAYVFSRDNAALLFGTNNTERARFTAAGEFLLGATAAVDGEILLVKKDQAAKAVQRVWNPATSGNNGFLEFATEASYTGRGSITYNRAGGLTAYNTTSDYRAKNILGPVQNSGATIDALKVYEGQMKGATQSRPMLVAHEAQEHAPYAVTGEKDAVNEDGTPNYQQMDVSALVPLLLAEVQSLRKRVAELESK